MSFRLEKGELTEAPRPGLARGRARSCREFSYIYMWNIVWHMKHKIASKTHIYIYEEYRVAYQIQLISQKHIYIYEEYRVAYPNCIWCFEENPTINSTISHI